MTTTDVKRQLAEGATRSLYIFTGDELEVQRIYINRIAESKKQIVKRVDSVAEATKSKSSGLMSQSFCFVCRDDPEFQKNEDAWDKVVSLLKDNTLIYQVTKIDKRSKFYDSMKDSIITFDHMSEQVLIKHIKEHVSLSDENCRELIRICESDYGRILSEIDKIRCFDHEATNSAFEHLVKAGVIYQPPEDAVFDWVDALLSGKPKLAFRLFQECLDMGEPPLRLLVVLYQGVKRLLQVQSCESKEVSKTTGLSQWEINLVKDKVGVYRIGELVSAMRNIKSLETAIKTGEIDEEFTVPYAMISLISC